MPQMCITGNNRLSAHRNRVRDDVHVTPDTDKHPAGGTALGVVLILLPHVESPVIAGFDMQL